MKKPLIFIAPLAIIALIAASAGGFFLWQALGYETATANDSVTGALQYYQKASNDVSNVINTFQLGDFSANFDTDSDFKQIATLVDKVNKQTAASLSEAKSELANYRTGLDQAAALKLKDSYQTYLDQRRQAGDELAGSLDTLASLTPLIESLYQGFSAFDKLDEMIKGDVSEDPAAANAQVRAARDELKIAADQVHALAAQNKMPVVIDEMNQYLLAGFDLLVSLTEAVKAEDFDRADSLSKQIDDHFSTQKEKDWEQRLKQGVTQWWRDTVTSQLKSAADARSRAEALQAEAQEYFDLNLK